MALNIHWSEEAKASLDDLDDFWRQNDLIKLLENSLKS